MYKIAALDQETIPHIVRIHARELSDDFLPSLGADVLSAYYQHVRADPDSRVLLAFDEAVVAGFVHVSAEPATFFRDFMKKNAWLLTKTAFRVMLTQTHRFIEGIAIAVQHTPTSGKCGEIMFIAVDRSYQQKGIGTLLICEANTFLRERERPCAVTKTLMANHAVVRWYQDRFQASIVREFAILRKRYVYLRWTISS